MAGPGKNTMRVTQLYTYPIKSVRGISLPSLSAMYTGFPHDRRFMLYKVAEGKNMHVAEFPEMVLFTTAFAESANDIPSKLIVTYTKDHAFDKPDVKVGAETLEVDLTPDTSGLEGVEITMHSSPCIGFDMGKEHDKWFSDRFGYEVKLLYIGDNKRKVLGNMPPEVAGRQRDAVPENANGGGSWLSSITSTASALVRSVTGGQENEYEGVDVGISFADVAPYLVISSKSWENAQARLPEGEVMDISKFRPNIIVEGADEAYEEDFWAELSIGADGAKLILTQNCARCNSLNVDYDTGKVGQGEAGKILKKLQSDRRVDPGAKWSPVFGRYAFLAKVPDEGKTAAVIQVGDEVEVLKRNSERTKFEWPNLSTN